MAEYHIVEPFDIDNGSLAGLTSEQCFTLGVEWAEFRARILAGERFNDICHTTNAHRISAMAERHGRFVEHHHHSEGWSDIFVGAERD